MTVSIIIFVGFLISLFFWGKKIGDWKTISVLLGGWTIKCFAAFSFFYVYSEIYGTGELTEDAGAYINEAKILNKVYHENPEDYYNIVLNKYDFEKTIIKYFDNVKISRIGPPSFLVNDTRNQIKFISLLTLIIGDNTFSVFVFFALLSFLGLLALWRAVCKYTRINPLFVFGLLLLPMSLLFWTSGPLKECTSIFGLEIFLAAVLINTRSIKWLTIGGIGILFTLAFKPYLLVILVFSYLLYYLHIKIIKERRWSYGLTLAVFIGTLFYFSIPKKVLITLSDKQFDFVNVARGGVHMEGDTCFYFVEKVNRKKIVIIDSMVHLRMPVEMIAIEKGKIRREQKFTLFPEKEKLRFEYEQFGGSSFFKTKAIDRDWGNLFIAIPEALINTVFRPFAWTNFLSFQNTILFAENLFFVYLLIMVFLKTKQLTVSNRKQIVFVLLISSILFSIVIGLTTPVSGAIVRYRIPIHLFIIVSYLLVFQKHEHNTK